MKVNKRLFSALLILSVYFISCYPKTKILGRYPDGKLKAVRHYKRGDSLNERFVYYYANGQKQYVRYWKGEWVYKMKSWYESGAKRQMGWMKEKDTGRIYNHSDSEYIFSALRKEYDKGWHENGKLKFEVVTTKDNFLLINYYDEKGVRTKQEFIKQVRPDGYDTVLYRVGKTNSGKTYYESIKSTNIPSFLWQE